MSDPRRKRMAGNPMEGMERGNVKLDRRHDRRDLSGDKLQRLFTAALASTARLARCRRPIGIGCIGSPRGQASRRSELASLTPEAFDLAAKAVGPWRPPTPRTARRRRSPSRPALPPISPRGLRARRQASRLGLASSGEEPVGPDVPSGP